MEKSKPTIIEGGRATDERGRLIFANDFNFAGVKRFYIAETSTLDTIRAFHGHIKEPKYTFVVSGAALVVAVEMDNVEKPNKNNEVHRFILSEENPSVLYIPAGYVNGFKSLEPGTKVMFFATSSLEETMQDDYRFPHDYWGAEVWEVENR